MKLSEDQMQKISENLKLNECCPNCGSTQMKARGVNIVDLVSYNGINGCVDTRNFTTIPGFTVTCLGCGLINMFDLDVILAGR